MPRPVARLRLRPRLHGAALRLGEREVPLRSGAMHYWRLAKEHWRDALRQVKALGLPMVETYVPWGVHEVELRDGLPVFDFGDRDPRRDLAGFLDLAAEEDLLVFVRPGPHINAELTGFGLPARVLDDPEVQARSPRGNPVVVVFTPKLLNGATHPREGNPRHPSVRGAGPTGRSYSPRSTTSWASFFATAPSARTTTTTRLLSGTHFSSTDTETSTVSDARTARAIRPGPT